MFDTAKVMVYEEDQDNRVWFLVSRFSFATALAADSVHLPSSSK
jgi:hypothetical protein